MSQDTDRIRALNDQLRQNLPAGNAVMTLGIAALGSDAVRRLVQTIATFDDFCAATEPSSEHDFGLFDFDGVSVAFKIEYYDLDLCFHSADAADPALTTRVITVMRADEI